MRKEDIIELLGEIDITRKYINDEFAKIQHDMNIHEILKFKVKTSLENLRSCLDYIANDIYDKEYRNEENRVQICNKKIKIYFPYGTNLNEFESSIGKTFKKLEEVNHDLFILIKSIQPFESGLNWLIELCKVTNIMKHDKLMKQQRINSGDIRIFGTSVFNIEHGLENGSIHFTGCTFNGVKQADDISINKGLISSGKNNNDIVINSSSQFIFKDTQINVIDLLNDSYTNIVILISQIYNILENRRKHNVN